MIQNEYINSLIGANKIKHTSDIKVLILDLKLVPQVSQF